MVKRLSTMWETWVQSLGWEDPLEKEMTIHSRTIARLSDFTSLLQVDSRNLYFFEAFQVILIGNKEATE